MSDASDQNGLLLTENDDVFLALDNGYEVYLQFVCDDDTYVVDYTIWDSKHNYWDGGQYEPEHAIVPMADDPFSFQTVIGPEFLHYLFTDHFNLVRVGAVRGVLDDFWSNINYALYGSAAISAYWIREKEE